MGSEICRKIKRSCGEIKLSSGILIKEIILDAPQSKVWDALTEKSKMKEWYFDLEEFKPEVGFEFRFYAGKDECSQYLHICVITEVIPERKLVYSWQYDGDPGMSYVSWELFPEGDKTRLVLTHTGLDTFDKTNPDLAVGNFDEGWSYFVNKALKEFVEK